ncbi:MAG: ergothioneine biosynthesis protein EgtC [Jatrophihabitans sp.]
MCRHLCYLGGPVAIGELVFDAPHSLRVQSYAPEQMRGGGTVNADGFGIGWFEATTAVRYRRGVPIWQDGPFAELARHLRASAVLAAVRNATAGMPVSEAAAAPFTDGRWLFSLNGRIEGWPDSAVGLADALPRRDLLTMDAPTDAALLWTVLRHRLAAGSADPAATVGELVAEVLAAAPDSRLNLLLTDGSTCYASTVTHSLWSKFEPGAVLLASEPLDQDPAWQPIPDGRLVVADRRGISIRPLPGRPPVSDDHAMESRSDVDQR